MQAMLIADFFRFEKDRSGQLFRSVGEFFGSEDETVTGSSSLVAYAQGKPDKLISALRRTVPLDLQADIGIENWRWLATQEDDGLLDLLKRSSDEVRGDLSMYEELVQDAADERRFSLAQHFQAVIRTISGRALLGYFAARNLLPKYGFPTDVVDLKTDHIAEPEAYRVELSRDLRIAISEYAQAQSW